MSNRNQPGSESSDLARVRAQLNALSDRLSAIFVVKAAPHLEAMMQDLASTKIVIADKDPNTRCAALQLLIDHWHAKEASAIAEQIATRDPDIEVRAFAVTCLGSCYATTNDERAGKILAEIVCNQGESAKIREAAYRALFYLRGGPSSVRPSLTTFRFPDDTDWEFVQSFLTSSPARPCN